MQTASPVEILHWHAAELQKKADRYRQEAQSYLRKADEATIAAYECDAEIDRINDAILVLRESEEANASTEH
jgi:uncharacterized coiled-coil DUF342 family protein